MKNYMKTTHHMENETFMKNKLGEPSKKWEKLGFCPNLGELGGLTESQLFGKISQN